jgi:hypothetical protein
LISPPVNPPFLIASHKLSIFNSELTLRLRAGLVPKAHTRYSSVKLLIRLECRLHLLIQLINYFLGLLLLSSSLYLPDMAWSLLVV